MFKVEVTQFDNPDIVIRSNVKKSWPDALLQYAHDVSMAKQGTVVWLWDGCAILNHTSIDSDGDMWYEGRDGWNCSEE